jgi:chromosome segregation ATPase
MNFSGDSKRNPAVLLLNEIEKLLAQTRLMEIHLEQARATAEEKMTRLQEEIQQLDGVRRSHEEEIAALRHQVITQERALTGRHEAVTAVELALHGKIQSLQQDLAQRDSAIEILNSKAASRAMTTSSKEQEFTMKTNDQDESLSQSAAGVEGGTPEQSLRDEINRLIREGQEKNQILQNRNEELVRVKAELDRLYEQVSQLESSRSEAVNALRDDSERMRTEFQAQLALLQAELSQREWTIEERQAAARGQEQNLRQEIESLRQQLAESKTAQPHDTDAFVFGEPRASDLREQHFEGIGSGDRLEGYTGSFAHRRRWQGGFGWKRRWRS